MIPAIAHFAIKPEMTEAGFGCLNCRIPGSTGRSRGQQRRSQELESRRQEGVGWVARVRLEPALGATVHLASTTDAICVLQKAFCQVERCVRFRFLRRQETLIRYAIPDWRRSAVCPEL